MHYYQHHIGDFIKDTNFLTNEEIGIYMKLLWLYYDTEKPLPDSLDALALKANCKDNKSDLLGILETFFELKNGEWHHSRCDEEIAKYHEFIASKSKAGKASAESKKKKSTLVEHELNISLTDVQLTTNHKPLTNNHKPIKNISPPDGVSDSVFNDYVKLRNKLKAPVTETALKGLQREAQKAGMSLEAVMSLCCQNGWRGFKAEWVNSKPSSANKERNQTVLSGLTRGLIGEDKNVGLLGK